MLSKNELKYIQSLCHKKQREAEGLFIAEGDKLVSELMNSHYAVRKVYALEEWAMRQEMANKEIVVVSPAELQKISLLQSPNQVLALVEQPAATGLPSVAGTFTLIADGIQDPGNFGTIIRIADWFGINQLVASEDTVELYNPKVIQATMGSFIRVNVQYGSLAGYLKNCSVPVFGAVLDGRDMYGQPPVKEAVLVIGNEGKGIRESIQPYITYPVTIPRTGGAESLNAAVAAGIIVSHIKRGLPIAIHNPQPLIRNP